MSYMTIYREKTKKFNTNKEDILNTRGKVDVDLLDEGYHYTMDMDGFENYDLLDKLLSTCLTEREKKIVDLRMDGLTWEVIGKNIINVNTGEYGINKTNVSRLHDRAMRKMRYFVRHNWNMSNMSYYTYLEYSDFEYVIRHIGNSLNVSVDGRGIIGYISNIMVND